MFGLITGSVVLKWECGVDEKSWICCEWCWCNDGLEVCNEEGWERGMVSAGRCDVGGRLKCAGKPEELECG